MSTTTNLDDFEISEVSAPKKKKRRITAKFALLEAPRCGWVKFSLPEIRRRFNLSYLTDVPLDWLNSAIYGLEHLLPFCVKGVMEPNRMICIVSYHRCHILIENEDNVHETWRDIPNYVSHTDMLTFCIRLHEDIRRNMEEWGRWLSGDMEKSDLLSRKEEINKKLERLEELIELRAEQFQGNSFFF